jgi:hypothetical protein
MNVYFNAAAAASNINLTSNVNNNNNNNQRMNNTNNTNNSTTNASSQAAGQAAAAILPSTSTNNNNPVAAVVVGGGGVSNRNINNTNMWGGDNDVLDANDDFDSDQLDEDESYSWASTDNQDVLIGGNSHHNSNSNAGGPSNGPNGGGGNSIANWRDWRSSNMMFKNASNFSLIGSRNAALNHSAQISHHHHHSLAKSASTTQRTNVDKLVILCAKYVAENVPFELVELHREPVPEDLQLKIAFHSFPDHIDTIRLYSCLANGNVDEYIRGEQLFQNRCVRKIIQIGFHLSAQVVSNPAMPVAINSTSTTVAEGRNHHHHGANSFWIGLSNAVHGNAAAANSNGGGTATQAGVTTTASTGTNSCVNVAVLCDRKRVVSCTCTCSSRQSTIWCAHIVAVCVHRILDAGSVEFRAPVSESLSKLDREQLQKFAQYLISELPQQVSLELFS